MDNQLIFWYRHGTVHTVVGDAKHLPAVFCFAPFFRGGVGVVGGCDPIWQVVNVWGDAGR